VKNLENVQGDERDVIVVSLTYGPDKTGTVHQRFGPIVGANGHRRLNVLFSRAKHQLIVVSSMKPTDVKVGPGSHLGVRILRSYLEFAAGQSETVRRDEVLADTELTRLVREVQDLGFDVDVGIGTGSFRLDVGVRDPAAPAEYLAGIEVDAGGGTDHARADDRDRTRPVVLRNIGWEIVSTWTSEWLREPATARRRLADELERTCRARGRTMPPRRAAVVIQPVEDAPPLAGTAAAALPALFGEIRAGTRAQARFEATGERIRIGRSHRCDVRVPDHFEEVSPIHAEVVWERDRYCIADAGSRNGVYLDGRKITREALEAGRSYGVRLGVGMVEIRLVYGGTLATAGGCSLDEANAGEVRRRTLPPDLEAHLAAEERQFLNLVRENGHVRTSELVERLGRRAVMVNGMVRQLRRKLHERGLVLFHDEALPNGEILCRSISQSAAAE
jgi:very-short-patch-repair endonuclease